jgi:tRNA (Thr-GGU) A37 N-methylase
MPEGRTGLPEVGLFATRAPQRPNPLDISAPRLLRRAGCTLWGSGIDAWPGTPILDIKGYAPRDDLRQDATVPDWLERLWSAHDAELGRREKLRAPLTMILGRIRPACRLPRWRERS